MPAEAAGERLDVFLAAHVGSRTAAQRLIDAGRVRVDGEARVKRYALHGGEVLELDEEEAAEPAAAVPDARFSIAWEDEHLLVVDKPAGVVVHPARGHRAGTLAQALERHGAAGGQEGRAGIVHRLDRDTSGLLVVARTPAAHTALSAMIAARTVSREYEALVEGCPSSRTGKVDAAIGRDHRAIHRFVVGGRRPREAVTHFEVRERLTRDALLDVRLETGRTHQIRVHMQAIGHPVCGDPLYGTGGRYGLERQYLHSRRIAFEHPITGEAIDVESPLPEDLTAALAVARRA
ncbi:MAG TPA: RluA family pseudouridine synthase [Solirubrobacterales bacterium]|nr:RluA family pseudouridine synthase [Solirubrobacterales bacterium]